MPKFAIRPGRSGLVVLAAVSMLAICGAVSAAPTGADRSAAVGIDAYMAPDLAPSERDYFRDKLGTLPIPADWNVSQIPSAAVSIALIDGATGTVHYNRPQDVGSWRQGPPPATFAGNAAPPAGDTLRNAGTFDPGVTSNTGPYRRVYIQVPGLPKSNNSDPSFKGIRATVTIHCTNGFHQKGDEGHIYLGGWSPAPTRSDPAGNVDAGLMYNYKQVPDQSSDDYTLFINLAGWTEGEGQKGSYWFKDAPPDDPKGKYAGHIHCDVDTPIQMVFGVIDVYGATCKLTDPTCSRYYLLLSVFKPGSLDNKNLMQIVIWAPDYLSDVGPFLGGWGELTKDSLGDYQTISPCNGCVFKFMTSIAQKPPGNYTDMSTFSATWSRQTITCPLLDACGNRKTNPFIALPAAMVDCSEYPLWGPYQNGPRDCRNLPPNLKGVFRSVGVSGYSADGETDDIRLIY